jgi:hypothetical protein
VSCYGDQRTIYEKTMKSYSSFCAHCCHQKSVSVLLQFVCKFQMSDLDCGLCILFLIRGLKYNFLVNSVAATIPSSLFSVSDKSTFIRQTTATISGEEAIPIHTSTGVRHARPCAVAHFAHPLRHHCVNLFLSHTVRNVRLCSLCHVNS